MKKIGKKLKFTTKLAFIQNVLYLIFGIFVYPLIPYLLNYPPNSIDNHFQTTVVGMQYSVQFVLLFLLGVIQNFVILYFVFRKLNNWQKYTKKNDEANIKEIYRIRNLCANGMYKLIPIHVIITAIILFIVFTLTSTEFSLTLQLSAIICIWVIISDLLLYVFTGRRFEKILRDTYESVKDRKDIISRLEVRPKMLFQYVSCLLVLLFVITLFGYSRILYERGEFLKEKELNELTNMIEENPEEILDIVTEKDSDYFILDENGNSILRGYEISKFAREYILHYPETNRTYQQYGSSIEGVFQEVNIGDKKYYVGKMYDVMPFSYTLLFAAFDVSLLIIYIIVIDCFSRSVTYQLRTITESLNKIGKGEVEMTSQLSVTSNDEFGDLIKAYNKVQENTQNYIVQLQEKQDIIVKQGQLVSIGELAGGVAHDINTPISAIKTGILMLNNSNVERTEEEKVILERMDNCATKIINIVNSMRNQIRNLGSDTMVEFKISDVVNDVKVITFHEVKKNHSEILVDIQNDVKIKGDPTKLGQVLTNLVVNGIQAYGEESGGKLEITVKQEENMAIIEVTDYAGGLDESITPFIFKNILTTKGTSGTGLGLYLSYSVIKGNFNGEITFETKKGEGTTFTIAIPLAEN